MFPSISQATPSAQVSTSFTSTVNQSLLKVTDFQIEVNGVVTTSNPLNISTGDVVTATVTSPVDFLWYEFFYYKLDDVPQSFAVVNESSYSIHVKDADVIKRWYLYEPLEHTLTFKTVAGTDYSITLGNTFGSITKNIHVILDPLSNSVYFYDTNTLLRSKVTLPGAPIGFVKLDVRDSIVVLLHSGESYEIYLNSDSTGLTPFFALRDYSEFTGELSYISRLPGEDLIAFLRRIRSKRAIPPATCITYNGHYIVAAGNGSVWVVDPGQGFYLVNNFSIDEYVLNITPLPDNTGVLLVTQSHKVYTMDWSGNFSLKIVGQAPWQPVLFNDKVYIPESETGRLYVYNPSTDQFDDDIVLNKFSPSYITVADGKMYVCGHDSEKVVVFDSFMNRTELVFPNKVTWVSVVSGTVMASHYLKDFKILDVRDLNRVIEIDFKPRVGPVSYIGTNIETIKTLGRDEVFAHTANDCWIWLNGRRTESNKLIGASLVDGDYVSVSYAARVPGKSRTNVVIGDTAYDYDVEAIAQPYYPRHLDFPILPSGEYGVHTRSFTLPKFFTPCLMSIEYGTLYLNDLLYYGDRLVYPEDKVTIEVRTCRPTESPNSVLPIFSLGSRQYAVPISASPSIIAPTVIEDVELTPNTHLIKEVDFTAFPSRYDYIIPGYYDISIRKNETVDITGNYYQQFGKSDRLTVEYNSSRKKYDQLDVYIIGEINYRFVAKNIIENLLPYQDFGNIVQPYTREILPQVESADLTEYVLWKHNNYQYYSDVKVISGLTSGSTANLSVVGGDTYFVLNGDVITDSEYVYVKNNDTLGLARTILNYFEETATITQHLPDPDDDLFADRVVGLWGVINQEVVTAHEIRAQNERTFVKTVILTEHNNSYQALKDAVDLLASSSDRKIFSFAESLEQQSHAALSSTEIVVQHSNQVDAEAVKIQITEENQVGVAAIDLIPDTPVLVKSDREIVSVETLNHVGVEPPAITYYNIGGRKVFANQEKLDLQSTYHAVPDKIMHVASSEVLVKLEDLVIGHEKYFTAQINSSLDVPVVHEADALHIEVFNDFNGLFNEPMWEIVTHSSDRKVFSSLEQLTTPSDAVIDPYKIRFNTGEIVSVTAADFVNPASQAGTSVERNAFVCGSQTLVEAGVYNWGMDRLDDIALTPDVFVADHGYSNRKVLFASEGKLELGNYLEAKRYGTTKDLFNETLRTSAKFYYNNELVSKVNGFISIPETDRLKLKKTLGFEKDHIKNLIDVEVNVFWESTETIGREIWGTKGAAETYNVTEHKQIVLEKPDTVGTLAKSIETVKANAPSTLTDKVDFIKDNQVILVGTSTLPLIEVPPLTGAHGLTAVTDSYNLLIDIDYHWQGFVWNNTNSISSRPTKGLPNNSQITGVGPVRLGNEYYLSLIISDHEQLPLAKVPKTLFDSLKADKEVLVESGGVKEKPNNYLLGKDAFGVTGINSFNSLAEPAHDTAYSYTLSKLDYNTPGALNSIVYRQAMLVDTKGSQQLVNLVFGVENGNTFKSFQPYSAESDLTYLISKDPYIVETSPSYMDYKNVYEQNSVTAPWAKQPYQVDTDLTIVKNNLVYESTLHQSIAENDAIYLRPGVNSTINQQLYFKEKLDSTNLTKTYYEPLGVTTMLEVREPIEKEVFNKQSPIELLPIRTSIETTVADKGYFEVKDQQVIFSTLIGETAHVAPFNGDALRSEKGIELSASATLVKPQNTNNEYSTDKYQSEIDSTGQFGYLMPKYATDITSAGTTSKGYFDIASVAPNLSNLPNASTELGGTTTLAKLIPGALESENLLTFKMSSGKDNDSDSYSVPFSKPEFDQGITWYNTEGMFGAFNTIDDAIYAARNYTEYRPFAILNSDLYSYRIIIDTNLVCEVPRGRHPVAWLIRGG